SGRMSKRTRLIRLSYSASSHGLRDIDDATPNLRVLDRRECADEFETLGGREEVGHGARLTIDHDWPVRALVWRGSLVEELDWHIQNTRDLVQAACTHPVR